MLIIHRTSSDKEKKSGKPKGLWCGQKLLPHTEAQAHTDSFTNCQIKTQIVIHRVSCNACGEMFCSATQKGAIRKLKVHVDKKCKILRFWKKANKILGRELKYSEVIYLMGLSSKKGK